MIKPDKFLVFDVESVGLHGEGFSVGYVVVTSSGKTLSENRICCSPHNASGGDDDRKWISENIPLQAITCWGPNEVREQFWREWLNWKEEGAVLVADCAWPVEARFLIACIDADPEVRKWQGPYPLHDLASVLLANGKDPLAITERLANELPAHDPLNDARQSARILIENLNK